MQLSGCWQTASWQYYPCPLLTALGLPFVALRSACLGNEVRGSSAGLVAVISESPRLVVRQPAAGKDGDLYRLIY